MKNINCKSRFLKHCRQDPCESLSYFRKRMRPERPGRAGLLMSRLKSSMTHAKIFTRLKTGILLMQRGEIYLASFPFGDVPGMKLRPVLLLTAPIGVNGEV